jgi:hypothetical protein
MATKRPRSLVKEVKVPTWVLVQPGPRTAIREECFPVILQSGVMELELSLRGSVEMSSSTRADTHDVPQ